MWKIRIVKLRHDDFDSGRARRDDNALLGGPSISRTA